MAVATRIIAIRTVVIQVNETESERQVAAADTQESGVVSGCLGVTV